MILNKVLTDVLIVGCGASGVAAAIQSARLGVKTIAIESTPWPGGMITSAGVSAFDGNKYALGGGIFGDLRKKIEDYYGGADKTFTGWISLTCFEPHKGKEFLEDLIQAEENLEVWYNTKLISVLSSFQRISGVICEREGVKIKIEAKITIEATEFGDVLYLGAVPHLFGRESKRESGENSAPSESDFLIQDMTYCAILKKNLDVKTPTVTPSENFDPSKFINSVAEDSDTTDEEYLNHKLHNFESFISYSTLPNDKYLLNWPFRANDYPTTIDIYTDIDERENHFRKAKELTLDYIYYMQTILGHPEWVLADDEFGTDDKLPFMPYVRESRRGVGLYYMIEDDVIPLSNSNRPKLRFDSIAVGDYFLDHHHSHAFLPPGERLDEKYPDNAPFQISKDCLIPYKHKGLIFAEKSISVTHIVNGCTRLQPVVMLLGQAAGALAALAVINETEPAGVDLFEVQEVLLVEGCQLFPYKDLYNTDPGFYKIQKLALAGFYRDNAEFLFEPDAPVMSEEVNSMFNKLIEAGHSVSIDSLTAVNNRELYTKIYDLLYK